MKKTSIFILLVTFLSSIFLVSFFGIKVVDDQFKSYIQSVEILTYSGRKPSSGEKFYIYEFDESKDRNYIVIDYKVVFEREEVSEAGLIEFEIISGNKTFKPEGSDEEIPYAEFYGQGNVLSFNHECAVTVRLKTTAKDGRGCYDDCQFICRKSEQIN